MVRLGELAELPLLVLSVAMIVLLSIPLFVSLSEDASHLLETCEWLIWAVFVFEYLLRLGLAEKRIEFIRRNWLTTVLVVLPVLRPLKFLAVGGVAQVLELGRVIAWMGRALLGARRLLTAHHLHYAIFITVMLVVLSAAGVYLLERGHGGSIDSPADALWWAVVTLTTVGYGDLVPVTPAGRGVATFLMLSGVTLFGVVTANLAAFLLESSSRSAAPQPTNAEVLQKLHEISEELRQLREAQQSEVR